MITICQAIKPQNDFNCENSGTENEQGCYSNVM